MPKHITEELAARIRRNKEQFPNDLSTEDILTAIDAGREEQDRKFVFLFGKQNEKEGA